MRIVRWEPFRGLASTQDQFGRLFNDTFSRFLGSEEGLSARSWVPPVDVYETDLNVVLTAELPGVDPKDVELRVEDNTLYLQGHRNFQKEVKEDDYHRVERSYGSFARSFTLPASVDSDQAKAEYKDGLLTLTLPKREEAKPKTIQVEVSKN
jgi:HSP20 family protein